MELTKQEQEKLDKANSIMSLAANSAWSDMCDALLAGEAEELFKLEQYLESEPHPDREEVMSMCLRWYGVRKTRRILVKNVEEAREFKKDLGQVLMKEFSVNSTQPVPEDLRELLLETM